jgi:hypothetical protein
MQPGKYHNDFMSNEQDGKATSIVVTGTGTVNLNKLMIDRINARINMKDD